MSGRDTSRYGRLYWCVGVPDAICETGQIYAHACRTEVTQDGSLLLWSDSQASGDTYVAREKPFVNLAFAKGAWLYFFAASVICGEAVAVDHWKGEVAE